MTPSLRRDFSLNTQLLGHALFILAGHNSVVYTVEASRIDNPPDEFSNGKGILWLKTISQMSA